MQQQMKMRLEEEKLKEIEKAIIQKQKEEEEKAKMEMMKKNDGMSGTMAVMMEQQMQMMLLMTNTMFEQSKFFTEEMRRMDEERKKEDEVPSRRGGVHSRVGRPNIKNDQSLHQFIGPAPSVMATKTGSAHLHPSKRPSYKPYQYPTRAVRPDYISNGTKKKSWYSSKMPDDLVLCELTDDGPVPAGTKKIMSHE